MKYNLGHSPSFTDPFVATFSGNSLLPRHRWFTFKEGFSEQLVRSAIESVRSRNRTIEILDPFGGCGTTAVTAGRVRTAATIIEVNPFLSFAAYAKCTPRRPQRAPLNQVLDSTLKLSQIEAESPLEGLSTFTEGTGDKWLFNRSVLRGFSALESALPKRGNLRHSLRLALFGALLDCCNAKRDGKCLRYKSDWRHLGYDSGSLRDAFAKRSQAVIDDLVEHDFLHDQIRVLQGDSRQVLRTLPAHRFDVVVTSPPYLNSFDYSDVYRPELFAGGFVRSNEQLRKIRLSTLRSHVQVAWKGADEFASPMLPAIIADLSARELWNRRLPMMIKSYFADIRDILQQCRRVVRKNGQAWLVVGNSAYGGIQIPVDEIIADIACRTGWQVREILVLRKLRASGQHASRYLNKGATLPLRESIVLLNRS